MPDAIPETGSPIGVVDPPRHRKQAVVLVHGMGQQIPMQTLRGFVDEVWVRDEGLHARRDIDPPEGGNPVWWKPDSRAGSLELSRITTRSSHEGASDPGRRTDFYEFYWADLTEANTIDQLRDWFMSLLWRSWFQVPKDVKAVWLLLWAITLATAGLCLWKAGDKIGWWHAPSWVLTTTIVLALVYTLTIRFVLDTFGDVARYVRAEPANIAARREIRQRGMALMQAISESGQYDRIMLVAHSLGSIIAYDLLKFLWSTNDKARTMRSDDPLHMACLRCLAAGAALTDRSPRAELEDYRRRQREVFDRMPKLPGNDAWLISDFVTIGSPLAHAQFLLARDQNGLEQGKAERRFPTCPTTLEDGTFLYQPNPNDLSLWQMHHASPFAAIPWTNIYDPTRGIAFGDMIGGPVRRNFGPGIDDVPVRIEDAHSLLPRLFTHTKYWSDTNRSNPHLEALRKALDLGR